MWATVPAWTTDTMETAAVDQGRDEGGSGSAASRRAGAGWRLVQRALPFIVLAAVITHPTQVTVRQWADALANLLGFGRGLARFVPGVRICVSELLLLGGFVLWLAVTLREGRLGARLRRYPPALLAFLGCAVLSAVPFLKPPAMFTGRQLLYGRALTEFVQLCVLFVCGYLVLADLMDEERWRRRLVAAFLCAAGLAVLVGLAEYARLRPLAVPGGGGAAGVALQEVSSGAIVSPVTVDGTFGFVAEPAGPHEQAGTSSNRNVLGAWASLVVPLFWGLAMCLKRPAVRALCGLGAAGGLLLLLHGGLWFATLLALLVMAYVAGRRTFAVTALGLFAFWAVVFSLFPQRHGAVLLDSVMLRKGYDRFYTLPLYGGGRPKLDEPPAALRAEDNSVWQQKYVEWQPGLQALARNALFGVGLGNYQSNIGAFYEPRPDPLLNPDGVYAVRKPTANLMESGANSFYLVRLVETGFAGLFAFLWVLMSGLRGAAAGCRGAGDWERGLALGSLGALAAMGVGMLFTDYIVRGVGVAVVFVLAAAAAAGNRAAKAQPAGPANGARGAV